MDQLVNVLLVIDKAHTVLGGKDQVNLFYR